MGNVNVKVNNFDVRLKRIQNQNHFLIAGLLLKIHIKQQAQWNIANRTLSKSTDIKVSAHHRS